MFDFFGGLWSGMLGWFGQLGDRIYRGIIGAFQGLTSWFQTAIGGFFTEITRYLTAIFGGLWDLVAGFFYLLAQALDVVIMAVQVLLYLVQVLLAVGGGMARSLAKLASFDPASVTPTHNPYAAGTNLIFGVWRDLGGDVIAQVAIWAWWFALATAILFLFARSRPSAE
jgi:Na+/pantothenate symporter